MKFPFLKNGMAENTPLRPPSEGPRRYTFEISLSGLIALSVAGLLGLVWVFILGVLLGRGYHPESAVPEIAQIMPAPEEKKAEAKPQPQPAPLKAEDLSYMDELTRKPEPVSPQAAQKPAEAPKPAAPAAAQAAPAASPEPAPAPAKPAEETAPAPAPAPAPAATPAPPPPPAQTAAKPTPPAAAGKILYTYQAASFRKEAQAKELEAKIDSLGVDARVESAQVSGDTWYRVLVSERGGEEDLETLRAKLKERLQPAGVKELIYRTKKPL